MREAIQRILQSAINAPSGGNSQPWHFVVSGDEILVLADLEKDHPVLNYRYRGTWMAHGALIENIKIAAAAEGLRVEIQVFPEADDHKLTARIKLIVGSEKEISEADRELAEVLPRRTTNRKRYQTKTLSKEEKSSLREAARFPNSDGMIAWTEDGTKIKRLAEAGAANEIVTLEDRRLHKLFFNELVWTQAEEEQRQKGILVDTMELRPPEILGLKLFKNWSVLKGLNKIGIARRIAASNANNYAATPLMGVVTLADKDKNFITAGRVVERLWLEATRLNLSFHLITGVMFYWCGLNLGGINQFSDEHKELLMKEYKAIAEIAGLYDQSRLAVGIIRIGHGDKPSAYSLKKPPEIEWR